MTRYFTVVAWDKDNSSDARASARDSHFLHIEAIIDQVAIAGPLKGPTGSNIGSLFVLMVDTAEEAEAMVKQDPYYLAGVWRSWDIHPFLPAAGEWIGGKIW